MDGQDWLDTFGLIVMVMVLMLGAAFLGLVLAKYLGGALTFTM